MAFRKQFARYSNRNEPVAEESEKELPVHKASTEPVPSERSASRLSLQSMGAGPSITRRGRNDSGAAKFNISATTAVISRHDFHPDAEKLLKDIDARSCTDEMLIFAKFMLAHTCYDLVPTSSKLVVFDSRLSVKKAFLGLIYNGVRAAPVWDAEKQDFVGMLTVSDFIRILRLYDPHQKGETKPFEELEEERISAWRERLGTERKSFIWISPDATLLEAVKALLDFRVHRLPVMDPRTGNVLYILTHKRILKFLMLYISQWMKILGGSDLSDKSEDEREPTSPAMPTPDVFVQTLNDVKDILGTYNTIQTVTSDTQIRDALKKFVDSRISALPVVDENSRVVDIYAKFDVITLAADKSYNNLDMPIKKALSHRNEWFEGVQSCKLSDKIGDIVMQLVKAEVHRLVVTDDDGKLVGIVSLSDLLNFLVLRPLVTSGIIKPDYDPLASSHVKFT